MAARAGRLVLRPPVRPHYGSAVDIAAASIASSLTIARAGEIGAVRERLRAPLFLWAKAGLTIRGAARRADLFGDAFRARFAVRRTRTLPLRALFAGRRTRRFGLLAAFFALPLPAKYIVPRFCPFVLSFFALSRSPTGFFRTAVSVFSARPISSSR